MLFTLLEIDAKHSGSQKNFNYANPRHTLLGRNSLLCQLQMWTFKDTISVLSHCRRIKCLCSDSHFLLWGHSASLPEAALRPARITKGPTQPPAFRVIWHFSSCRTFFCLSFWFVYSTDLTAAGTGSHLPECAFQILWTSLNFSIPVQIGHTADLLNCPTTIWCPVWTK